MIIRSGTPLWNGILWVLVLHLYWHFVLSVRAFIASFYTLRITTKIICNVCVNCSGQLCQFFVNVGTEKLIELDKINTETMESMTILLNKKISRHFAIKIRTRYLGIRRSHLHRQTYYYMLTHIPIDIIRKNINHLLNSWVKTTHLLTGTYLESYQTKLTKSRISTFRLIPFYT